MFIIYDLHRKNIFLIRIQQLAEQLKMIASPTLFQEHDSEIGSFRQNYGEQMPTNQQDRQHFIPNINMGTPLPCKVTTRFFSKCLNKLFSLWNAGWILIIA